MITAFLIVALSVETLLLIREELRRKEFTHNVDVKNSRSLWQQRNTTEEEDDE